MGQFETNLKNKYERTLTKWQRTFRINCGLAWAGRIINRVGGVVTLANASPVHGAEAGVSDLIGFDSVIITPEMVGKRVAVFVATELKATKNDKLKKKQIAFRDMVVKLGGIHREVREDSRVITTGWLG